jgi:4-amino-4-deoxy-L-arabinose transferase-like glycosyltransferase
MILPLPRWVLGALAVVALAVGLDNMDRPLANPDEGRYSEISREMVASGDWLSPRLNGFKYFEKPPLQYWATAIAFKLFGQNEISARLYVVLCGLGTLLIVGFTGMRLMNPEVGLAAMLALVASPYFMALGGIVTLDMGLTIWTTATLCALLLAERAVERPREHRRWMLAAWAAIALAVLSKGLVGIVFPAAAVFIHCALRRDFSLLRRLEWLRGSLIFLAIAAPWFIAVSLANPEFAEFFFIHEHFQRFLTRSHRRVEPVWYFIPVLALGFLPWMFALPSAVAHAWRAEAGSRGAQPLRLVLAWCAFIVVFFSASGSKLPAYILPAFPPLALVLGRYLVEAPPKRLALWSALTIPLGIAFAVLAWRLPDTTRDEWVRAIYRDGWWEAFVAALAFLAAGVAATILLRAGRRWAAMATVAFAGVVVIECIEDLYEHLSPRQSGLVVAQKMKPLLTPATRIYTVSHYEQSVPFYIARTMILDDYEDEFQLGMRSDPDRVVETLAEFPEHWLRPGEALAIMHPKSFEELKALGLPMQVVHDDPRRILVRKP